MSNAKPRPQLQELTKRTAHFIDELRGLEHREDSRFIVIMLDMFTHEIASTSDLLPGQELSLLREYIESDVPGEFLPRKGSLS